jgi:hypothetical protein
MGEAYVTMLLQIGDGGVINEYNRLNLNNIIKEYKKYIRSYRIINRDAKIDEVIAAESASGLKFKGIIPNVMIEVRTDFPDANSVLRVIDSELLSRLDYVRDIQYLKAY